MAAWRSAAPPPTCGRCRCGAARCCWLRPSYHHIVSLAPFWTACKLHPRQACTPLAAPSHTWHVPPCLVLHLHLHMPACLGLQEEAAARGYRVLTPLVSLDTPGKATVQVVILADPDGHEVSTYRWGEVCRLLVG